MWLELKFVRSVTTVRREF